jgi:protein-S-isoprenylcysteine O-methyltransferase Ste14
MEPIVAKTVYLLGYWPANFAIRAPYIRARHRQTIRCHRKSTADTVLFLAVSIGGFIVPLIYAFSSLLSFADFPLPLWCGVLGTVLLLAGDWLFWRAHKDLGADWSPVLEIRQSHTLVTHGIYRRIRHPMYSSLWLLVVAQAMILPNYVAGFLGLLPFAALYFIRVRQEERMMAEEFGNAYHDYSQRTGGFFPKFNRP